MVVIHPKAISIFGIFAKSQLNKNNLKYRLEIIILCALYSKSLRGYIGGSLYMSTYLSRGQFSRFVKKKINCCLRIWLYLTNWHDKNDAIDFLWWFERKSFPLESISIRQYSMSHGELSKVFHSSFSKTKNSIRFTSRFENWYPQA